MKIDKCEFDARTETRSTGGLMPGIFSQDVGFRFKVNIHATDPKEIDEMLTLFNKAAADFNETWNAEKKK